MHSPSFIKGRGSLSNPDNRYQTTSKVSIDDGWWQEELSSSPDTQYIEEVPRSIISTNQSPDLPYDQSINPYRGCEHGCIYCYARPSHAFWDYSPGLDFETRIIVKNSAADLLRRTFSRRQYQCKIISIGANTDPYQPIEKHRLVTRELLEVCREFNHPVTLITKSALILRDLDILAPMAEQNLCSVAISVTTLENELKRKLEPRTASPEARLKTIEGLSRAGIPVTLMVAPIIPAINDAELEDIMAAGRASGAVRAHYILLRLPLETSDLFREWLAEHFPDRKDKVMHLLRDTRSGKDYEPGFFKRFTGTGVVADLIRNRFQISARQLGFAAYEPGELTTQLFNGGDPQLRLF